MRRISATVVLIVLQTSCYGGIQEPTSPGRVLRFTPTPTLPIADGTTPVGVQFHVDSVNPPTDGKISVATTVGTFPGNAATATLTVDALGNAYTVLHPPSDAGTPATITATAGGVTEYFLLAFAPANADRAQLTTTGFVLKSGFSNALTLTFGLLRSTGAVSPGMTVTYSADTLGGSKGTLGFFQPSVIVATGASVTSIFTAGDTTFRGTLVLRATAQRGDIRVTDSILVRLVP